MNRSLVSILRIVFVAALTFIHSAEHARAACRDKIPADVPRADASTESAEHAAADAAAPQTYLLRYQFVSGQKQRYLTRQTATMDAAREDQRKTDRSEVEQRRVFTVEQIDDAGVAHITMQFEFVRMQLQSNKGEPVVYHTDMKPEDIPKMFQMTADRLRGSAARYQVLATGESNPEIEKVIKTVADQKKTQKSEDGTFLMPLPSDPVAVGDTWKDIQVVKVRVTENIDREIQILRTFRLDSVTDNLATIQFVSSIISPIHSPAIRAQLIQSTPRGTLQFDIARGAMVKKDLKFDHTVINGAGENTVVSSYGTYVEELLDNPAATTPATPAATTSAAATTTADATAAAAASGSASASEP